MSNYQVYLNLFSPFLQHWLTWFLEEMNVVYKRGVKKICHLHVPLCRS